MSELTVLFTVPSAKWKCENWLLLKNIKLALSSRDSFSTCCGVFYLSLMAPSFRQGMFLGHVWTLTGSLAPSCKSGHVYCPPAGRFPLPQPCSARVRSRARHLPFPWVCCPPPPLPPCNCNLCPGTRTWLGDGRGSSAELCGKLKAGKDAAVLKLVLKYGCRAHILILDSPYIGAQATE